ncbi:Craniofacial development protein 2 [Holothuria leucospilota]|uniref:Craniofacial development protein 2 n=1 Tax=Holothuria leucospilota TaxID=206669 RepID=A0A9Q1BTU0_HOLLE|nr:Craniofacial development protein 2 [Holothuria leucospilota]
MALTLGTWNVRTLLDNPHADRPERRTALVARELARYRVDIAALSETRLPDKVQKLPKLSEGLNDRLMTLQLPLSSKKNATIISGYAPTMTNPMDVKDRFYEELDLLIASVPQTDKLVLLGDLIARVGSDHQTWPGVIGMHGVRKCNSNGLLLLKTCATHNLSISNTMFRLPTRYKTSWMHSRSRNWHLIDYVIIRKDDRNDVRVIKAMCGADCWTDHRRIISKLNLHIKPRRRPQGQRTPRRLDISKLKVEEVAKNLSSPLSALEQIVMESSDVQNNIEEQWASVRDILYSTALEHLGPTKRKHQDWFDDNNEVIQSLLSEKHRLLKEYQNDPSSTSKKTAFNNIRRTVQTELRNMQDVDGTKLLTDRKQILERWAEHFNSVLNRP